MQSESGKKLKSVCENLTHISISKSSYEYNMDSIMLPSAFDVEKITYGSVKTNDNGGKSIYMSYNGSPIILQTPEMFAPFGKQKWDNEKSNTVKYTIDLSFKDYKNRPGLNTFFNKISELDAKLIDDGTLNQFDWLKKKGVSRDTIKELYTSMIKYPTDKITGEITDKYPPTIKFNIPFRDDNFQCEFYDESRNLIDINAIETKGAKITAIIQCLGIWSVGGKFGCSWKCLQMKIRSPKAIKGFAFQPDNDTIPDNKTEEDDDEEHGQTYQDDLDE